MDIWLYLILMLCLRSPQINHLLDLSQVSEGFGKKWKISVFNINTMSLVNINNPCLTHIMDCITHG